MNIASGATILGTKFNILTLSFAPEIEQLYLKSFFKKSLTQVRIALIIAIVFYGIFGILDAALAPAYRNNFWIIRYVLVCPYFALLLPISFTKYFQKYMQPIISSSVLFAGAGIIWMIIIGSDTIKELYYAGLILVFFYGYTFFKLRFIWATSVGWAIVVVYEIAAIWITPSPIHILINNNFFFLSGNIMGMVICFSLEYYSRKSFVSEQLLEAEKKKVDDANADL